MIDGTGQSGFPADIAIENGRIADVGRCEAGVFLAMELVEGATLRAWLAARSRPWREIVSAFVDAGRGLQGECDFILALTEPVPRLRAPLVTVVEAKKNDIEAGLGQCVAQMVAARDYNERESTLKGDALLEAQDRLRAAKSRYRQARLAFWPELAEQCRQAGVPVPREAAEALVVVKNDVE